jgi:uncharacterized protein DUF6812
MDTREERVIVETERYRLTGTVRLPAEGYRSRLTDHLNAGEHEFLALTDVEIVTLDDPSRLPTHHEYVALGRRHIVFATSAADAAAA